MTRHTVDWSMVVRLGDSSLSLTDHLKELYLGHTDAEIAVLLTKALDDDVTPGAVTRKRQNEKLFKTRHGVPQVFTQERKRYNDPPVIRGDDVLVMADVHAPFHNAEFCSELVDLAKYVKIKTVILAGDLLDFAALSSFTPNMLDEVETDDTGLVSDEIVAAASFCDVLLDNFDTVLMTLGNHEERITRRLAVQTRVTLLRHLLGYRREERFQISPYYYAIIKTSDGQVWRITHPKNYSVIPVRVAARLADKYGQNVVAAHGHDWGETISTSGHYAAACGMCADGELFEYTQLRDSVSPFMQSGAFALVHGQPLLLHPERRNPVMVKGWYR